MAVPVPCAFRPVPPDAPLRGPHVFKGALALPWNCLCGESGQRIRAGICFGGGFARDFTSVLGPAGNFLWQRTRQKFTLAAHPPRILFWQKIRMENNFGGGSGGDIIYFTPDEPADPFDWALVGQS